MMISICCLKPATIAALTAITRPRDGRPAAARPAAQRRWQRAILLFREEADRCGRRGRRSLAAIAGKRPGRASGRILGPDTPAKGPQGGGPATAPRRASALRPPPSAMTAAWHQHTRMRHKARPGLLTTEGQGFGLPWH